MIAVLLAALSSSYLTLGVAAPHIARALWAPYAVTVCALAAINLWRDRYGRKH